MNVREIKITDEEAATVGVHKDSIDWGSRIRPLLIAKGVPADYLVIGGFGCVPIRYEGDGTVFEVREK